MDPSPLDLLLTLGLTARLIRLAVVDDIADRFRARWIVVADWISPRVGDWSLSLWGCPFCIGFWISVAVAAAWWTAGDTPGYRLAALAGTLSYVAGHLVAALDMHDEE